MSGSTVCILVMVLSMMQSSDGFSNARLHLRTGDGSRTTSALSHVPVAVRKHVTPVITPAIRRRPPLQMASTGAGQVDTVRITTYFGATAAEVCVCVRCIYFWRSCVCVQFVCGLNAFIISGSCCKADSDLQILPRMLRNTEGALHHCSDGSGADSRGTVTSPRIQDRGMHLLCRHVAQIACLCRPGRSSA
jgi:hypothetical protein